MYKDLGREATPRMCRHVAMVAGKGNRLECIMSGFGSQFHYSSMGPLTGTVCMMEANEGRMEAK